MKHAKSLIGRRALPLLLALCMALSALTACGGQTPDSVPDPQPENPAGVSGETVEEPEPGSDPAPAPEPEPEPAPEPEPEPEPDPIGLALEQYRAVVGQADTYDYGSVDDPTGTYRYALVRMNPADSVPALLLEQDTAFGISYVCVFQYDVSSMTVLQAAETLMEGVASAGGYRGSLSAAGDGNGLLSTEFSSGSGEGSTARVVLENGRLRSETLWEGNIFDDTDPTADQIGFADIDWHDVGETAPLESWTPDAAVLTPTPETAQPAEPDGSETALPTDGDRIVFRGTLNSYTYDELVTLQGEPDPNAEWADTSQIFWLILPDEPQNMNLKNGDGLGYREALVDMIDVTYAEGLDQLQQYAGQQLVFSIDPSMTWWPSDTSLPLGRPGTTGEIHVL